MSINQAITTFTYISVVILVVSIVLSVIIYRYKRRKFKATKFSQDKLSGTEPSIGYYANKYKGHWDKSTKEFEVLVKRYRFHKYTRSRANIPRWQHYKYYNTIEAANDALRDLRRRTRKHEYPGERNEADYPKIRPVYKMERYVAIKRDKVYVN